jgi:hypothetical protein
VDQFKLLVAMKADVSQGNITLFKARFDEFSPQVLLTQVIPYLRTVNNQFDLRMQGLAGLPVGLGVYFDLPFFSKLIKHVEDEARLSHSLGLHPSCAVLMVDAAAPFTPVLAQPAVAPAPGLPGRPAVTPKTVQEQAFAVATAISELADGTFSLSQLKSKTLFSNLLQTLAHYRRHCPAAQQPTWLVELFGPNQRGKWADTINQVFGSFTDFSQYFAGAPVTNDVEVMNALYEIFDLQSLLPRVPLPGVGPNPPADCFSVRLALKPRIEASKIAQNFDAFSVELARKTQVTATYDAALARLQATALDVFGVDYANPNAARPTTDALLDALAQPGRGHALFKSVQGAIPRVDQGEVFACWIRVARTPRPANVVPNRNVLFVKSIIADVVKNPKRFTTADRFTLTALIGSLPDANKTALFDQLLIGGPLNDEAKLLKDLVLKLIPNGKADAKNPSVVAFFNLVTANASPRASAVVMKVMSDKGLKINAEMRIFVTRFRRPLHVNPINLGAFRDLLDVFNIESDAQFRDALFSALSPDDLTVLLAQLRTGMGSRQGDAFLDGAKTWMQDRLDLLAKSKETVVGGMKAGLGRRLPKETEDDRDKFKAILEEMMFLPGVGAVNEHNRRGYIQLDPVTRQPLRYYLAGHPLHGLPMPLIFASHDNSPIIPRRGIAADRNDADVIDYDRSQLTKFLWSLSTDGINLLRDHFEFTRPLMQMMGVDHYLALTTKRNKQSSDSKAAAHAKDHIKTASDAALKTLNADARNAYEAGTWGRLAAKTKTAINAGMGRRFLLSSLGTNVGPVIKHLHLHAQLDGVLSSFSLQDPIGLMQFLKEKPYDTLLDLADPAAPALSQAGDRSATARSIHAWLIAQSGLNPRNAAETNWDRLLASEKRAKDELDASRVALFVDRNYGGDRA